VSAPADAKSEQDKHQLRDITLLSWVVCLFLVTPVIAISQRQTDLRTDFVYFYSLGRIANEHPAYNLYDYRVQQRTFQQVQTLTTSSGITYGPSPYPPYVALLFRPLARVGFTTAQRIWRWCTFAAFVAGIALLLTCFYPRRRHEQLLILAAALSFYPFIVETFLNGQVAVLGFLGFTVALWQQQKHRPFRTGIALSVCLYKPPLLILALPMLLIRRQWRVLAGFIGGTAVLIAIATVVLGARVWTSYFGMLISLRSIQSKLNFSMYVDLLAFWSSLFSAHVLVRDVAFTLSCLVLVYFVVRAWLSSADIMPIWSATLTCSLLVNVYVATYDTIILIPGAIATAQTFSRGAYRWFLGITAFLLVSSWFAQPLARATRIQILTIALILLGTLQIWGCLRLHKKETGSVEQYEPVEARGVGCT
jgi:hypothetical protein